MRNRLWTLAEPILGSIALVGLWAGACSSDTLSASVGRVEDVSAKSLVAIAPAAKPNLQSVTITELTIGYGTPSLSNVQLTRGPVNVEVSYTAREDITRENRPLLRYEIFYEGQSILKDEILAVGYGRVIIGDFDVDGAAEVAVQGFTGGANCCTSSLVYSWRGGEFEKISLGEIGGDFEDVDGDGAFELVTVDKAFLSAFSSHAGSVLPPKILRLEGDRFVEATREYPEYVSAQIAELEARFGGDSTVSYSLLAAYVADKALIGEYESAWAFMLEHYSGAPDYGSAMYKDRETQYEDFPTALAALLEREGYR